MWDHRTWHGFGSGSYAYCGICYSLSRPVEFQDTSIDLEHAVAPAFLVVLVAQGDGDLLLLSPRGLQAWAVGQADE